MRSCSPCFSARETATVPPAAWRWPIPVSLRILCIEDDPIAQREIVAELSRAGFLVEAVADGAEGFKRALEGDYAAVTLDRNLPSMDGLEVVRRLREGGRVTPVLMISAFSDVDDRVRGLRAGGDDYLAKPFASEEMAVRVESLIRRHAADYRESSLTIGDLELDFITRSVRRAGVPIELQNTEFRLLRFFMLHPNELLTRAVLFEQVWNYHFDPKTNLIDVHLGRLRRKLDGDDAPSRIETVRGKGFVFHGR